MTSINLKRSAISIAVISAMTFGAFNASANHDVSLRESSTSTPENGAKADQS